MGITGFPTDPGEDRNVVADYQAAILGAFAFAHGDLPQRHS